jgi:gas vesicle protein
MTHHKGGRDVVYVDRGEDASAKWLFWGAMLGAGLALLYAPRSGEETRRSLQRTLWKLRAMTEEKLDELTQQFGGTAERLGLDDLEDDVDDAVGDYEAPEARAGASPRQELERRLAETRARRRGQADREEPLA